IGFKPTFGVVPRSPGWPGWFQLNHVGPITATPEDMSLAMSIMAGEDAMDPSSVPVPNASADWSGQAPLRGTRVAYSRDLGRVRIDPEVARHFNRGLEVLAAHGVELVERDPDLPDVIDDWY